MDLSNTPAATVRHDGWTPARKAQFLDRLAQDGNVLASCALVGLSREAAYRLRRRDPLFARAWAAAQALAREASAQVLGTRAIEGIEEEVWYRGEVLGTRRRYDNRLLLAHVARLDRLAEANPAAQADAGRFDELLARAAGLELPAGLEAGEGGLPPPRAEYVRDACHHAELEVRQAAQSEDRGELDYEAFNEAIDDACVDAWNEAAAEAGERWDAWIGHACATIDRLLAQPRSALDGDLRTLSGLSTSPHSGAVQDPDEAPQPAPE